MTKRTYIYMHTEPSVLDGGTVIYRLLSLNYCFIVSGKNVHLEEDMETRRVSIGILFL